MPEIQSGMRRTRRLVDVSWWATYHVTWMAIYTVTARADQSGFDVEITGDGGAHQTTLRFASEEEANAWIVRATRLAKPWMAVRRDFGGSRHL